MKNMRFVRIPVLALAALLLTSCAWKKDLDKAQAENKALTEEKARAQKELSAAGAATAEMQVTLDEVQKGLEELRVKELKAIRTSIAVAQEGKAAPAQRDELKAEIAEIRKAVAANLEEVGADASGSVLLADAGYWSEVNATAPGPDRLIATMKSHRQREMSRSLGTTEGPPPPGASAADAMEHRLRTHEGASTYAARSHTVEPVFAGHKDNRGFRRFSRRGLDAVSSEWSLINTTHNLRKLWRSNPGFVPPLG